MSDVEANESDVEAWSSNAVVVSVLDVEMGAPDEAIGVSSKVLQIL